jgi:hypothetical protein
MSILCPKCGSNRIETESCWCDNCRQWVEMDCYYLADIVRLKEIVAEIINCRANGSDCHDLWSILVWLNGNEDPLSQDLEKAREDYRSR